MQDFTRKNIESVRNNIDELIKLDNKYHIGAVGRRYINEIQGILTNYEYGLTLITDDMYNALSLLFPIDTYTFNYFSDCDIDPLHYLPSILYKTLMSISSPSDSIELGAFKIKLLYVIEAILGYACDYATRRALRNNPIPRYIDVPVLIDRLLNFKDKDIHIKNSQNGLLRINKLYDAASLVTIISDYNDIYLNIINNIRRISPIIPIVVKYINNLLIPDWAASDYYSEKYSYYVTGNNDYPGNELYLPRSRVSNGVTSINISHPHSLHRIIFEPRTSFWKNKLAQYYGQSLNKENVLILGHDKPGSSQLDDLLKIKTYLNELGYYGFLLKELEDVSHQSLTGKVAQWGCSSRFCVMVDPGFATGHATEYAILKSLSVPFPYLKPRGKGGTLMTMDARGSGCRFIEYFDYDNSPLEVIGAAISWVEGFLTWKTGQLNLDLKR
jgi:hypothetical protein